MSDKRNKMLGEKALIHGSATVFSSKLGPYTEVGPRSMLLESQLGAYSYLTNDCNIIYSRIGKFCAIAAQTRLNPGAHPMERATQHHFTYRSARFGWGPDDDSFFRWRKQQPVTLGHDVWVGHGVTIMAGVTVGTGAVIGAGAVVTKDVAPYTIVAGVAAKPLRMRFSEEIAADLLDIAWWDWPHEVIGAAIDDFRRLPVEEFVARYRGAKPSIPADTPAQSDE